MKKLIKKLEDIMVAVTFAEAGEFDEANRLAGVATTGGEETGAVPEGLKRTALESAGK